MPGVQFEEVWKSLYTGYTRNSLEQMLRTRLSIQLENIVPDGSMRDIAFDLLSTAEKEGWGVDLIREAYRFNSRNPDLLRVYQKYGLAPGLSVQQAGAAVAGGPASVAADGLERTIKERLPAFDMGVWRERMAVVEGQVCRVEINGNAAGTGFLVGADKVLTNYHVLEQVLTGPVKPSAVTCRFDYKVLRDGSRSEGVVLSLHATDWRVDDSPFSAAEKRGQPDAQLPTADELDYALVRLERPLGHEPVAPKAGAGAPSRGWIPIPASDPPFAEKMPLLIAQHPDGQPLKLAIDTEGIIGLNANGTRVRYATNTEPGASGSPCFDMDWGLIALHHYGDPAYHQPRYNQGVPIAAIHRRLTQLGKAGALDSPEG
jgi:hypothetical protein